MSMVSIEQVDLRENNQLATDGTPINISPRRPDILIRSPGITSREALSSSTIAANVELALRTMTERPTTDRVYAFAEPEDRYTSPYYLFWNPISPYDGVNPEGEKQEGLARQVLGFGVERITRGDPWEFLNEEELEQIWLAEHSKNPGNAHRIMAEARARVGQAQNALTQLMLISDLVMVNNPDTALKKAPDAFTFDASGNNSFIQKPNANKPTNAVITNPSQSQGLSGIEVASRVGMAALATMGAGYDGVRAIVNVITPPPAIVENASANATQYEEVSRSGVYYTVQSGDTLWLIAFRSGISLRSLLDANPDLKKNPNLIRVEQQINIPGKDSPSIEAKPVQASSETPIKQEVHIIQALELDCEAAATASALLSTGHRPPNNMTWEDYIVRNTPSHPTDPHSGYVGNIRGDQDASYGSPNYGYGVYAEPISSILSRLGIRNEVQYGTGSQAIESIKQVLNQGGKVVFWFVAPLHPSIKADGGFNPAKHVVTIVDPQTGKEVKLIRGEHAAAIVGYDKATNTFRVSDPATANFYNIYAADWAMMNWGAFGGMRLAVW